MRTESGMSEITPVLIKIRDELLDSMRANGFWYNDELRHDATTWDINNGLCEDFGETVIEHVPDAECDWADALLDDDDAPAHYVVIWHDRYYDAECVEGVDNVRDLPIFAQRSREETTKPLPTEVRSEVTTEVATEVRGEVRGEV